MLQFLPISSNIYPGQAIVNYKKDGGLFECCSVMVWIFLILCLYSNICLNVVCFNCDLAAHMID